MLKYGLNPKDKEQLEIPKFQYTGFGRGDGDYIHIYAYTADDPLTDENDVLVADEIFPVSNVDFFDEKTMDIDVGGHLRQMGLDKFKQNLSMVKQDITLQRNLVKDNHDKN